LAGTAAGAALGPVGAVVGGALGGTAGQMIGDKLGGNEETDEGKLGAVAGGALGGYATKSVKGAMSGAKIGSALQDRFAKKEETNESDADLFDDATCNMTEAGENCSVHGMEECWGSNDTSPLAGQYGHSGKMKPVAKDLSFLDRLKELSGMKK
jgi:phage tail tape-measure protein